MNVSKSYMSGSATKNCILLIVLPRLNKNFNQSITSPAIYNLLIAWSSPGLIF